jgi:hypothetical protein
MHPQTMTNTESMLLRYQSSASSFFILEMPPPSFKAFQNRHTQKIKSLYNKQQLLNACLTESNPTPKKEPPPQEKPKQNKHPTIPELTLFLSNNSLHCCCLR